MTALLRLLRYAAPYRLGLFWAIAAMIVYAAKMAGMPVGPLALTDGTAIDLGQKML